MRVKVTKMGYYDLKRRFPNQIIEIDPKLFSDKWMKKIDDKTAMTSQPKKNQKSKIVVDDSVAEESSFEDEVI